MKPERQTAAGLANCALQWRKSLESGTKNIANMVESVQGGLERYRPNLNYMLLDELSWQPQESFHSGLRKTVEWATKGQHS